MKEFFSYNPLTGVIIWLKASKYHLRKIGTEAGCRNGKGYWQIEFKGKHYLAHRLAWFLYYGVWPLQILDHINGNPLDNRITNLREVSSRENSQNQYQHRQGKLPGTSYIKKNGRWRAYYKINNRYIHIGIFETQQLAHEAYLCKLADLLR